MRRFRASCGCRSLFAGGEPGRGLLEIGFPARRRRTSAQGDCPPAVGGNPEWRTWRLVNQRGLQFVPRVQAIALGQTVRFTNQDGETHNVHVVSPGFAFNQSMSPGQPRDFTPDHAGVMRLACDIHHHMRGFVVVSPTPLGAGLRSRRPIPARRRSRRALRLTAWHEMGDPLRTELDVIERKAVELPPLVLSVPEPGSCARGQADASQSVAPVRPWADVVDRIA